jgi:DNA-binding winged helix-turn-helix (wHTH) protein/Tfp pilus assembly protein PilF
MTNLAPKNNNTARTFKLGDWHVEPQASSLLRGTHRINVEPKVMDLLVLLAQEPGRVYSRADIESVLWPDVVVGEDSLARAVSKLRRALGDTANSSRYIQTIPKRGYRLITDVVKPNAKKPNWTKITLGLIAISVIFGVSLRYQHIRTELSNVSRTENSTLTRRADNLYMQFTRADNEAAISLYQRVIAKDPSYARAQAGLANALVQRVVRWQSRPGEPLDDVPSLTNALNSGLTETVDGRALLSRAAAIAEGAVRLAPDDPRVLKALAFTHSAQGDLDRAIHIYRQAIAIDKNAWAPMINLGEIYLIRGERELSIISFEQAYAAMERVYAQEPQKVGLWQAALGIAIGDSHDLHGSQESAEHWYRRVLKMTPFEPMATTRLIEILRKTGRSVEAKSLCAALSERIGRFKECPSV